MANVLLIAASLCLIGAAVSGVLGFVVYPRQVRKAGKRKGPSPARDRQGMARAMFILFMAAAFTCGFFGLLSQ